MITEEPARYRRRVIEMVRANPKTGRTAVENEFGIGRRRAQHLLDYARLELGVKGNIDRRVEPIQTGEDELFETARELVVSGEATSVSTLQVSLGVGYVRAKRLYAALTDRSTSTRRVVLLPRHHDRLVELAARAEQKAGAPVTVQQVLNAALDKVL